MTFEARPKGRAKQKKKQTAKPEQSTSDFMGGASGEASESAQGGLSCSVCQRQFQSRNKLFQHIKSTGHAVRLEDQPKTNGDRTGRGSKVKRKKKK